MKTLHNYDENDVIKNVSDVTIFGDGNLFKLLSKAASQAEGWMKSTKAMEIEGVGCVVQVTTQQGDNIAEALTFVPGVKIEESKGSGPGDLTRRLIPNTGIAPDAENSYSNFKGTIVSIEDSKD